MNNKSVLYFNSELRESRDSIIEENKEMFSPSSVPTGKIPDFSQTGQGSPGELKRSQTLNCDWKKSSTMPHNHHT